jgi:transcription elongation factor GreA
MIRKIQFTRAGLEKAQKDFDELTEKRKTSVLKLQEARAHGDLSENGAYKAARFELSDVDRELRRLKYLLRFGEVVEVQTSTGQINFGNVVTIKNPTREMTFTLVGPYESNPKSGSLSVASPVGKAVLGHKKGDMIVVFTPNGKIEYEIIKISQG